MRENDNHPDFAVIDAVRTGEATPEQARHVETCETCRPALVELCSLAGELGGLTGRKIDVPAEVDRKILSRPTRPWWLPLYAAAAVMLAVGAGLIVFSTGIFDSPRAEQEMMAGAPEDIDNSGRVDILDAYLLAKKIKDGEPLDTAWDVDRSGKVDEDDVDYIAKQSVSLGRSGR